MERKYRGRHSKKDEAWVSSWKQEERKWMKDDMVYNLFQVSEATDEKDLDLAIAVFGEGMDIDKEEEDRSDRAGTYRGKMVAR